jgi:hypothetical protein
LEKSKVSGVDTQLSERERPNQSEAFLPAQPGSRALLLPLGLALGLAGFGLIGQVRDNPKVLAAFLGAAVLLCAWDLLLIVRARRTERTPTLEVSLRKQHYVQACAQLLVLVYWGWFWPPVSAFALFILAQLIFGYAFDMLLGWSRRDSYTLGFSVFPVIFSINLFLWFKPDWFYLQFAMLALGFAAKELIRWNREGRRVHIFNPSSFPLAVFSLILLASRQSGITWGQEIATTQFYPPHMYLMLFLIGLPGQLFFGVTTMTMSAVLATCAFSRIYFLATGVYYFYDSYIPIAVFLGMHLLFNDPSTSPRTELGRIAYGVLYGLSTVVLYGLLGRAGMPTFYDKLLQVPLLNLSVKGIDWAARSRFLRWLDPAALGRSLVPRQRNLAYMSVLSATEAVGDNHPGQWLPFWRQACQDGRKYACPYVADVELGFCNQGSAWACNEAGLMHIALSRSREYLRRLDPEDPHRLDPLDAGKPLRRGCELGSAAACRNLSALIRGSGAFTAEPPVIGDYPIILRGSKGEIREQDPSALYALACREGWPNTCQTSDAASPGQ